MLPCFSSACCYLYIYIYCIDTPRVFSIFRVFILAWHSACLFYSVASCALCGFFYSKEVWFNKLPLYEYGGTQALVGERSVPTGLFS